MVGSSEVLRGVGIISSQVFGHLRSFKGWIQTEACVIPSYYGMINPDEMICSTQAKA